MKSYRGMIGLAMVVTMVFSSFGLAFASGTVFTDIANHWAREYIEDIYDRGVTQGYREDATFRPGNAITNQEVLIMIANLLGYREEAHGHYKDDYEDDFDGKNIADWAQGEVAYAMEKGILTRDDLQGLSTSAERQEVAIYIGKLLENHAGEAVERYPLLPYSDELRISNNDAKSYIDLLLRKDILNPESNDGQFLPENSIIRAEVAKMISEAAAILDNADNGGDEDVIVITVPKQQEGIFLNLVRGNRTIITVLEEDEEVLYDVVADIEVTIDRRSSALEDLEKGQLVELEIEEDKVIAIHATTAEEVVEGYFSNYLEADTSIITIRDKDRDRHAFNMLHNAIVTLEGEKTSLRDFRNGDEIKLVLSGDYVVMVEGVRKDREVDGVITATGPMHRATIDVKMDNGGTETFFIERNTEIRRDRRRSDFEDLRIGDEVTLQLEYDEVIHITASSVRGEAKGTLRQIVIGDEMQITIRDRDGELEDYIITDNTTIRIDNARAEIYDLRLNYELELDLENRVVTRLYADSVISNKSYDGRVTDVRTNINALEVEIGGDEVLWVYLTNDTLIEQDRGRTMRLGDIREGDRVTVIVQPDRNTLIADRIIVY